MQIKAESQGLQDLLAPAAFENVITDKNADKIKAKTVLELANGPVTPEADEILHKKNISVIPDILANSGGVTVSYFEWEQNLKNEHWNEEEVFEKLKQAMEDASQQTFETAHKHSVDLRRGAFILALGRIGKKSSAGTLNQNGGSASQRLIKIYKN